MLGAYTHLTILLAGRVHAIHVHWGEINNKLPTHGATFSVRQAISFGAIMIFHTLIVFAEINFELF